MREKKLLAILCAGALSFSLLSACSNANANISPSQSPSDSPEPSETSSDDAAQSEQLDDRGIPGMKARVLYLIMTNFDVPVGDVVPVTDESSSYRAFKCSSSATDSQNGFTYDYTMSLDEDEEIVSATIGISSDFSSSNTSYAQAAQLYLWTAASIPYDTSDTDKSSEWIESNIPSVADNGGSATLTVGDVKYDLFGTKAGDYYGDFWVNISKVS